MEAEQSMTLKDLPVNTRNYTIIDNITGKPIDQANYSLTIDPEVIKKLNKLKIVNEEKVKQAALRGQYQDTNLVSTFTPTDNAVFTPLYEGEYINYHDFVDNTDKEIQEDAAVENTEAELTEKDIEQQQEEETYSPTEVLHTDNLLDRVVARDPSTIPQETEETPEEQAPETDYITTANTVFDEKDINPDTVNQEQVDNSTFTAEMTGLQQASEQIVQIDTSKLGPAIKPPKEARPGTEKIKLDKLEIVEGKKIAWLGYLLFFIPLLFNRKNRFVRLHANEGLELNIMEIVGVALVLPFLLVKTLTGTMQTVSMIAAILGASILGACALTIIPMMIVAMCGIQFQIPWLWRKRIIYVPTER